MCRIWRIVRSRLLVGDVLVDWTNTDTYRVLVAIKAENRQILAKLRYLTCYLSNTIDQHVDFKYE